MKRLLPLILFALMCFPTQVALATPSLSIELSPEPAFNQIWAYKTYSVNVALQGFNLSQVDLTGYTGTPSGLRFDGSIVWKGRGGYHFGGAATGYTYNLNETHVSQSTLIDSDSILFNLTLEKDALDYGMNPFENVEVTISFNVYLLMSDGSTGPKVVLSAHTWNLVDEVKVDYLEGKFTDMQGEILAVTDASGLDSLNRKKYLGIIEDMNSSLTQGNYIKALDTWENYDNKERANLMLAFVRASNIQYEELAKLESIKNRLAQAEKNITRLQDEYNMLEASYTALATTYHKVNAQLDSARRNLTTAITAVFLSAIVFYFLGRGGIKRREETPYVEPSIH
jgi:hypothetical protein